MPWRTKLVARSTEFAALEAEIQRAASGEFRCVLLVGEPGLGKTRLAVEAVERCRRRVLGISARAYPLGQTASFGVWAEALDRHLRSLPPDEVSRLCGGFLDDLAVVLRSVAAIPESSPAEGSRFRLFEGLAVLLGNLAARSTSVVFLDDIHFADASSWEFLSYLGRSIPKTRLLVIAAARPWELSGHDVGRDVALALEQDDVLRRIDLHPLGPEGVVELAEAVLGRQAPDPLGTWLVERSGGNPLFAIGLLQALLDERADLTAPELPQVPESLAERVGAHLRRLDEPEIATLETLAVLGRRVEVRDLLKFSDRPLDRLAEILRGLVRSRLVIEEERGRELTYDIAHPLVHDVIYQGIGGARRRVLHRVAGQSLRADGRLGEAAPHFARSADVGDPEAIEVLRDAVREAEGREAYTEALEILNALVELLPHGDRRWLEVFDAVSWRAEWVVDHRPDAEAAMGIKAMRAIDALLDQAPSPGHRACVKLRLT
ncbi:MAG TPA: AAA family ATPase, partial [Actinomycetota bacterium]|nr:AAA family ATPase [Actinomycetota bacterium]